MIRFMMCREQEWTHGSQIRGSPPRSCRSIASSLQPSVRPASAPVTVPPLHWDYSPLYLQHLHSGWPCQASVSCWTKGWLNKRSRNSEASLIQIQFPESLTNELELGGRHSVGAEDARWSVPYSSWQMDFNKINICSVIIIAPLPFPWRPSQTVWV